MSSEPSSDRRRSSSERSVAVVDLLDAASAGDLDRTRAILAETPDLINARGDRPFGPRTALHVAAAHGHAAVVEHLIGSGADVLARDAADNATPLHWAAFNGHLEPVKILVAHGADVNANDDLHLRGPLGWATCLGELREDVAAHLIESGARVDIFSAIALGNGAAVRRMAVADPSVLRVRMSEYDGRQTPLRFAVARHRLDIARMLLDVGAPIDLPAAVALGRSEEAHALLAAGVERPELDATLLWAADAGQAELAAVLVDRGADVNFSGGLPLLSASWRGYTDMVRLLASRGADLEAVDVEHRSTALGWAAFHGFPGVAEVLLAAGASVDQPNRYGATPLALALSGARGEHRAHFGVETPPEQYEVVAQLLRKYGATGPEA